MAMGADVNVILTLNLIVDVNISFLSNKDLKALLWSLRFPSVLQRFFPTHYNCLLVFLRSSPPQKKYFPSPNNCLLRFSFLITLHRLPPSRPTPFPILAVHWKLFQSYLSSFRLLIFLPFCLFVYLSYIVNSE